MQVARWSAEANQGRRAVLPAYAIILGVRGAAEKMRRRQVDGFINLYSLRHRCALRSHPSHSPHARILHPHCTRCATPKSSLSTALYLLLLRHQQRRQHRHKRCESDSCSSSRIAVAVTLTVTVTITNQPHTSTQVLAAGVSDASDASDALPAVSIASNLAQVSDSGSDSDSGSGSTPSTSPSLAPRRTRAARKVGAGMGGEARQGALLEGWAGLGGRGGRGCRATLTTAPRCACAIRRELSGQRGDAAGALFFAVWQLLCVGLCSQRPG